MWTALLTRPFRLTQNEPLIVCEEFIVAIRFATLNQPPTIRHGQLNSPTISETVCPRRDQTI